VPRGARAPDFVEDQDLRQPAGSAAQPQAPDKKACQPPSRPADCAIATQRALWQAPAHLHLIRPPAALAALSRLAAASRPLALAARWPARPHDPPRYAAPPVQQTGRSSPLHDPPLLRDPPLPHRPPVQWVGRRGDRDRPHQGQRGRRLPRIAQVHATRQAPRAHVCQAGAQQRARHRALAAAARLDGRAHLRCAETLFLTSNTLRLHRRRAAHVQREAMTNPRAT